MKIGIEKREGFIQIEPNQRFGYGCQIRVMDGPQCEVYDDEPLTLAEALISIQEAMEGMNLKEGANYQLRKVTAGLVIRLGGSSGPRKREYERRR